MSLSATFDNLWVNLRNIFRGMNTEPLPWKADRPRSERYRASFALVHDELGEEACIGCHMCAKICPSDIITVVAGGRKESPVTGKKRGYCDDFTLDLNACIICELCVQVCPTDAIVMLRVQEPPGFQREDLVLTMDKLYANEELKQNTWGTGTRLVQMQGEEPKKPKAKKPAAAEAAPAEAAKAEAVPAEATKAETAPAETAPTETAPAEAAATETAPTETAPDKDGPE
jgi:NADH-quinone oxidoreductase subunit I